MLNLKYIWLCINNRRNRPYWKKGTFAIGKLNALQETFLSGNHLNYEQNCSHWDKGNFKLVILRVSSRQYYYTLIYILVKKICMQNLDTFLMEVCRNSCNLTKVKIFVAQCTFHMKYNLTAFKKSGSVLNASFSINAHQITTHNEFNDIFKIRDLKYWPSSRKYSNA